MIWYKGFEEIKIFQSVDAIYTKINNVSRVVDYIKIRIHNNNNNIYLKSNIQCI